MPVFLRWLLADVIVMRVLRHIRRRRKVDQSYPMEMQVDTRDGGRVYVPVATDYRRAHRRRRSCCSGCLFLIVAVTLGVVLIAALVHWAW